MRLVTSALRISHSSVVDAWRERDRELERLGVRVTLVCAESWEEGGARVEFRGEGDDFAVGARTIGRHPNLFLFDPRPIWRLLARRDIDLLDLQEEPFSLVAAEVLLLCAARRVRRPFVVYSAQNLDKHYPPPFRWIERWVLARAAGAYPCNTAAGERLRRRGFSGVLAVLPLGVDVDRYHPADREAPVEGLRVGYVGRLARHKGVHVLIEAVAGLEGCTLVLVGEGPERASLARQIAAADLSSEVSFLGHLVEDALPACYRGLDVLAVPSLPTASWTEQFGRVVVEAMASGVPVVASTAGALPDVVGDAGLLVPPGDSNALRAALLRLSTDPELWGDLRRRGLERAERFRWSAVAASQRDLYQQVRA